MFDDFFLDFHSKTVIYPVKYSATCSSVLCNVLSQADKRLEVEGKQSAGRFVL